MSFDKVFDLTAGVYVYFYNTYQKKTAVSFPFVSFRTLSDKTAFYLIFSTIVVGEVMRCKLFWVVLV